MRLLRTALAGLALVLVAGACASSGEPRDETPTYVTVDNQSRYDMTIYVVRDNGQRVRIGRVTSVSEERFEIPSYLVFGITTLRFLADPLAAQGSPISNQIAIVPGEEIHLTIPPM
ncbi:MAG TPA: hypothetical protein VFU06_02845 [Longimicrobiales bacterium]|nr:hypothetical protein [Longimicrobiales bacterium]